MCKLSPLGLDAYTFLANSRISKNNCGRWGSLCFCESSIMLKTEKTSTDSWKTYERPSTTTWFVHDHDILLYVYRGDRWCNKWRSTTKDVGLW